MDVGRSLVVERLTAQPEQVDALKTWLQLVAERTRCIPGIRQLELLQNQQNPAEFIFFLIVDDLPTVDELLDQADWHKQLVGELPHLIAGNPERVVGVKID